jgi:hypothetical protein
MTETERARLARAIYETVTIKAGYEAKTWTSLHDWERHRWLRAADTAYAHLRVIEAGRIARGRAA